MLLKSISYIHYLSLDSPIRIFDVRENIEFIF